MLTRSKHATRMLRLAAAGATAAFVVGLQPVSAQDEERDPGRKSVVVRLGKSYAQPPTSAPPGQPLTGTDALREGGLGGVDAFRRYGFRGVDGLQVSERAGVDALLGK